MWVLAELTKHWERERWRRLFGTEFTGESEGRPVRLTWRWCVTGHVCVGDPFLYGHLKCIELGGYEWRFVRSKA